MFRHKSLSNCFFQWNEGDEAYNTFGAKRRLEPLHIEKGGYASLTGREAKALFRFLKDIFEPDKPIQEEMDDCQNQGGPVGSAVPDEYKPGGRWAKPEGQGSSA